MRPIGWAFIFIIVCAVFLGLMYSKAYGEDIDWDKLVASVIQIESGGNPDAIGTSGEIGLMQITPIVVREWQNFCYKMKIGTCSLKEANELFNPTINKRIGTWYLKRLHNHYGFKTVEEVVQAYNCGPTRAKTGKIPKSTIRYRKKVMKIYKEGINETSGK